MVISATICEVVICGIWAGVRAVIWLVLRAATCVVVSEGTWDAVRAAIWFDFRLLIRPVNRNDS